MRKGFLNTVKTEKAPNAEVKTGHRKKESKVEESLTPPAHKPSTPSANAWSLGLSNKQKYEWFTDCYRMRVDDLYVWSGGQLVGLYDPDATPLSVVTHFWIFCKMAVNQAVVPKDWKWKKLMDVAGKDLQFAFEKSDAKDKYGRENVFGPFIGGGRSLRYTALVVSNTSLEDGIGDERQYYQPGVIPGDAEYWTENIDRFDNVGGKNIWYELFKNCKKWKMWAVDRN
eukprot:GHVO01020304.1.p1 GENE.GHVO01020304.1~~GHVO01020304.1.p1  ORF type:complete len:227 (-),score=37.46 GHVO01020304.1:66-746(-)